jgi:hypothetical protein
MASDDPEESKQANPKGDDRGYPWLKTYTSLLDNPRYLRMTDTAKAVYFELYLLAGKADAGGLLLAGGEIAGPDDIAYLLRRNAGDLRAGLSELQAIKFITLEGEQIRITNFETEQGPSQKDKREQWHKWNQTRADKAKEKEKELNKDKDIHQEQDIQTVTGMLQACNDDDEEYHNLTKILSTQTAIKAINAQTIGELKELMRAKRLTIDDLLAGIRDLKVNPKAKAPTFTTIGGLANWSEGCKTEKIKALDPHSYEGDHARRALLHPGEPEPTEVEVEDLENLPTGEGLD